jgi:carboxyl-terminal processing protease
MRNAFKTAAGISFAMLFSSAVSAADIAPQMPDIDLPPLDLTSVLDATLAKQIDEFNTQFIQNSPLSNPDLMPAYRLLLSSAEMVEKRHIKKPSLEQLLKGRNLSDFIQKLNPDKTYEFDDFYPLITEEINAMLSGLDPHSYYAPPLQQKEHFDQLSGQKTGIGIYYESAPNGIRITGIVTGSPAEKTGLKKGDLVTQIGGVELAEDAKNQFDDYISTHNELSFGISSTPQQARKIITLSKGQISTDSLDITLVNDEVAYVTLFMFTAHTSDEFKEKFALLNETYGTQIKSLVFDVRNNGGGILDSATDLADALTKQGLLLGLTETTDDFYNISTIKGNGAHQITDLPITIVINSESASSAEVFAGILQDYKRAKIIGKTQSFGKGTFQNDFLQIVNGELAAMALTTGFITLPVSGPYQGKGIWPDIHVTDKRLNLVSNEKDDTRAKPSYERDLDNYINLTKTPNNAHIDASYSCQISSDLKSAFVKITRLYSAASQTIDMSEDPSFLCAIDQNNTHPQYSLTFQTGPTL